jgi:hypothetical protein
MDFKIRIFKTIALTIGLVITLLGLTALFDSVMHSDYSMVSIVSIVGFLGIGLILLSVADSLKFALMDSEIDQKK